MSSVEGGFEPAELLGDHYRLIGGSYGSFELALEAVKAHNRNRHGGGVSFRVYRSQGVRRNPTIVEVVLDDRNPLMVQALYKVFEGPLGS
jgi:hypothetical protein